jgi:hypothetical protein
VPGTGGDSTGGSRRGGSLSQGAEREVPACGLECKAAESPCGIGGGSSGVGRSNGPGSGTGSIIDSVAPGPKGKAGPDLPVPAGLEGEDQQGARRIVSPASGATCGQQPGCGGAWYPSPQPKPKWRHGVERRPHWPQALAAASQHARQVNTVCQGVAMDRSSRADVESRSGLTTTIEPGRSASALQSCEAGDDSRRESRSRGSCGSYRLQRAGRGGPAAP